MSAPDDAVLKAVPRPRPGPAEPRRARRPPRAGRVRRTRAGPGAAAAAHRRPGHGPEQPRTAPRPAGRPASNSRAARVARPRARRRPAAARHVAVLRRHARDLPRVPRHGPQPAAAQPVHRRTHRPSSGPRWMPPRTTPAVLRAFRRFRHRHTLRIGINDIIRDRPLEEVTRELARVADASIEVALQHAAANRSRRGSARPTAPGRPAGPDRRARRSASSAATS